MVSKQISVNKTSVPCLAAGLVLAAAAYGLSPGGSNFAWYGPAGTPCYSSCYGPYGVIANYDVASGTIDNVLSQMYANGQRSVRIPIFHQDGNFATDCTGPEGRGTTMDSTGGTLPSQCLTNLANLLASVKNHGFNDAEISFHPQAFNNPRYDQSMWPDFWTYMQPYETYYQENLALIGTLRPIFISSGLNYKSDLFNEGSMTSSFQNMGTYAVRMWSDYTQAFGKADTIGFSIACDWYSSYIPCSQQLAYLTSIYNGNDPVVFSFHFYDNPYDSWTNAWNTLAAQGRTQGWIIGESYYNDSIDAQQFAAAHNASGNVVFFVTQWPIQRGGANITPPVDFSAYSAYGW